MLVGIQQYRIISVGVPQRLAVVFLGGGVFIPVLVYSQARRSIKPRYLVPGRIYLY